MTEHEVRVLEIIPDRVHDVLLRSGARMIPQRRIYTKSYTFPHIVGRDMWARLRLEETREGSVQWELSLKSRQPGVHTAAEEICTGVTDEHAAEKLLVELGATLRREIEKFRTTYVLDDLRFDVDKFIMVPPYLEIEGRSPERVLWGLQLLGYSEDNIFRGESVFRHYNVHTARRVI